MDESDLKRQLFGLMAVAQEHQKAVQAALDALIAERSALAGDRAALAVIAGQVSGAAGQVQTAAAAAMTTALSGASAVATKALGDATAPVVSSLSGAAKSAGEMDARLSKAVASFGWKWGLVAGGAVAGGIVAVVLTGYLMVEWQRHQVEELSGQRQALIHDVADLQVTAEDWAKRAGRARLQNCGDQHRLCVQVDQKAGVFKDADGNAYEVLKGY